MGMVRKVVTQVHNLDTPYKETQFTQLHEKVSKDAKSSFIKYLFI